MITIGFASRSCRWITTILFVLVFGSIQNSYAQVDYAYLAIHLEPGNLAKDPISHKPNTRRPSQYWQTLSSLIKLADSDGGHQLTLMFTAQWAQYVIANECTEYPETLIYQNQNYSTCLELVRAWEANGHEIAFHHHRYDAPASWDGFSRTMDNNVVSDDQYLGNLDDLLGYLNQLPSSGQINSGTSGEWFRDGMSYAEGGYDQSHLLTHPSCWYVDGHFLWRLGMRHYLSSESQQSVLSQMNGQAVGELPDAIASESEARVVGLVSHASNVAELGEIPYKVLFNYLSDQKIRLQALSSITKTLTAEQTASPEQTSCVNEQGEPVIPAIALDENLQVSDHNVFFIGGVKTAQLNIHESLTVNPEDEISISLRVDVANDIEQITEQIIAVEHHSTEGRIWYQYRSDQGWQSWDTRLSSLKGDPFNALNHTLSIDIFQGRLSSLNGSLSIYAGYRMENQRVVVNAKPLRITVD